MAGETDRELTYSSLLICAHGYGYIKNNLRIFDKNTVLIGKIWKNMDLMGQHYTFFHSDLSTHNVLQGKNTVVMVTTTANFWKNGFNGTTWYVFHSDLSTHQFSSVEKHRSNCNHDGKILKNRSNGTTWYGLHSDLKVTTRLQISREE